MRDFKTAPPGAEKFKSIETEVALPDPVELKTENDFVDFWSTFWRNNGLDSGSSDELKNSELKQARDTIASIAKEPGRYRYFGARDSERMVATGNVEIKVDNNGKKHGYLDRLTVDEKYRGKGMAKKITDVCSEYAKEVGCSYIDCSVNADNPTALVTKLNDGYLVTGLELFSNDEFGLFDVSKRLDNKDGGFDQKKGKIGNLLEVDLSDLKTINDLLSQGYVGIDVKNIGSKKDDNPKNWLLILENNI